MAYWDDPEQQQSFTTGAAAGTAATGAPATGAPTGAPAPQPQGTGFTNLSDWLGVNQGAGADMGNRITGQLGGTAGLIKNDIRGESGRVNSANAGLKMGSDPNSVQQFNAQPLTDRITNLQNNAKNVGSLGGMQAALGPAATGFDAAAANYSDGDALRNQSQRFTGLNDYLNGWQTSTNTQAAAAKARITPPPPKYAPPVTDPSQVSPGGQVSNTLKGFDPGWNPKPDDNIHW
jgi:hypothetical protein